MVAALAAVCGTPVLAQSSGVTEVPLTVAGGRFVVEVMLDDGTPLEFAISNGNATTVVSEALSHHIEQGQALFLSGLEVPLEQFATVPTSDLMSDGHQVHGLIAANMLSDYDVLLDAPNRRMVLKPFGRSVDWPGMDMSDPVRIRVMHGVVMSFQASVEGQSFGATLDLGTPANYVNDGLQSKTGLDADGIGVLGLGDVSMTDMPFTVRDLPILKRWDPEGNGFVFLGAPIAYDCAISLSWIHQELRTCVR